MSPSTEAKNRNKPVPSAAEGSQPALSRSQLITQARRLACEHVENAHLSAAQISEAHKLASPELAVRILAHMVLDEASVDLMTEES